ncbi:MAG: hypothetical protein R2804_07745 [Cyclobacteriaceae bacterium]
MEAHSAYMGVASNSQDKLRLLISIVIITLCNSAYGQIVNSLSANKTGMFYYAIDSLIATIAKEETFDKVVLRADLSIIDDFPDLIRNFKIIKQDKIEGFKTKGIGNNDVVFRISGLSIIRDQVTLTIGVYKKGVKALGFFAGGAYSFYFKYLPETGTYILTKIEGLRM